MQYIVEGILLGLMLTIMLGPILIALIQTTIQHGSKAGFVVGSGIWVSDFLIIFFCYYALHAIGDIIQGDGFRFWLGLIGGIILMIFGLGAILKKVKIGPEKNYFTAKNYAGFWLKGFLVNTVNPFTFIFWIGVISSYLIAKSATQTESLLFLGSIMVTIIISDCAKVILAKYIKEKMTEQHIQKFNKVAGLGLLLFGVYLMCRSII